VSPIDEIWNSPSLAKHLKNSFLKKVQLLTSRSIFRQFKPRYLSKGGEWDHVENRKKGEQQKLFHYIFSNSVTHQKNRVR